MELSRAFLFLESKKEGAEGGGKGEPVGQRGGESERQFVSNRREVNRVFYSDGSHINIHVDTRLYRTP